MAARPGTSISERILPLEPAGKMLNAGYRKKQKRIRPPQVRSAKGIRYYVLNQIGSSSVE